MMQNPAQARAEGEQTHFSETAAFIVVAHFLVPLSSITWSLLQDQDTTAGIDSHVLRSENSKSAQGGSLPNLAGFSRRLLRLQCAALLVLLYIPALLAQPTGPRACW